MVQLEDSASYESEKTARSCHNTSRNSQEDVGSSNIQAGDSCSKKRRKRRTKKKAAAMRVDSSEPTRVAEQASRSPVLCISRNKHWRYISSYHGPWLQLPVELLESLLSLNLEPGTFAANDPHSRNSYNPSVNGNPQCLQLPDSDDSNASQNSCLSNYVLSNVKPSAPVPPPIDPGVFKSVASIRRFIDEASDLAVRAASGLSAAALGAVRNGGGSHSYNNSSPWTTAHSFGMNPFHEQPGNGRNVTMSATRIHRLRALAVGRLAAAYRADEIAASVMVMQGASALDDIAERVLKIEPHNLDARYVHFFHEKIPSRQLAECTTTEVLDELIRSQPHVLEYYRTRGIVHCFRDDYQLAIRDFTFALKEGRSLRKGRHVHNADPTDGTSSTCRSGKVRKGKRGGSEKANGQVPSNGTAAADGEQTESEPPIHPSLLPDAPTPLEHQLLFLRGAAYLQCAVHHIEQAVLELEGISRDSMSGGTEIRLRYLDNGCYGGVEVGNRSGSLGHMQGKKVAKYRSVLSTPENREKIVGLLKKSIRDHEKFLLHFDTFDQWNSTSEKIGEGIEAEHAEVAYLISEAARSQQASTPRHTDAPPASFTTYHPLLVESHFSILLCLTLMGQFETLLPTFVRVATLVDNLEGYPIFLPARSMAQAEFVEVLERLASGWQARDIPGGEPLGKTGERLAALKTMLIPVMKRLKDRAEEALHGDKKRGPINIPLHGPRVDIILAWLGATHLPDLLEATGSS